MTGCYSNSPGAPHDTIDNHFNDWNWRKTVQFGPYEFEDAVPDDVIEGWQVEVTNWECDPTLPNPYQLKTKAKSERVVCLKLAKAVEAKEDAQGIDLTSHELHASVVIANGLVIEEDQHKLTADTEELGQHPTEKQLSGLLERSNQLHHKIAAWIETQALFMPEVSQERVKVMQGGSSDRVATTKAYDIPLWLPSQLLEKGATTALELQQYKWKLREGQANNSLEEI
ncbi:hypothetical protein DXG01_000908 [Tephrocybe rancida]|nr:hypothetical protein DXG01_000908 [Tephrocybe rancida]